MPVICESIQRTPPPPPSLDRHKLLEINTPQLSRDNLISASHSLPPLKIRRPIVVLLGRRSSSIGGEEGKENQNSELWGSGFNFAPTDGLLMWHCNQETQLGVVVH